jgi:tetratricopeptide (TPR) repeat protein
VSDDATKRKDGEAEQPSLALDLTDALDSWELDLDQVARAESTPLGRREDLDDEPEELSSDVLESLADSVRPPPTPDASRGVRKPPPPPPASRTDEASSPASTAPSAPLSAAPTLSSLARSMPEAERPPATATSVAPPAKVTLPPVADAFTDAQDDEDDDEGRPTPAPLPRRALLTTSPPDVSAQSQTVESDAFAMTTAPDAWGDDAEAADDADSVEHEGASQGVNRSDASAPPSVRRMYQPPSAEELARFAREPRTVRPPAGNASMALLEPDSGSTIIEANADELLDAIMNERPSGPDDAAMFATRDAIPEHALPTPVVSAGELTPTKLEIPTPLVRAEAPVLEIVESSEVLVEDEIDPTDVSERPGWADKRKRLARLHKLASRATGAAAAELWVSAGELAEELAEPGEAEQLYERALVGRPHDPAALRALARLAFRGADHPRYGELLERASENAASNRDRARTLATLALVRWVLQHDATGALRAITEAAQLAPDRLGHALLLARVEAATYPAQLDATLLPIAERSQDRALAAMWWVAAGRAREQRGDLAGARTLYQRAASADPYAFDAQLSMARMEHALGDTGEAARALLRTLESFDIGPVAEAVRRRAANMLATIGGHAEAHELLEHASDDVSLRTAMQIAYASGDRPLQRKAAEAWALGTDGSERAPALLSQAELLAADGDAARAEEALELAALADPQQALVSVAREALARKSGDAARLAEIVASEEAGRGALVAAARLAAAHNNAAEELTWLREAAESDAGLLPDLLSIDAAAELARLHEVEALLASLSERGSTTSRVRTLLAIAEIRVERGDVEAARACLLEAAELAPGHPLAERAYARLEVNGGERAAAYEREAADCGGRRAAFLHLRSGFAYPAGSGERIEAFARAFACAPEHAPAIWALHREARKQGDLSRLSALHGSEATRARDVPRQVAHLVRAALIRASEDTETAAEQLTRAVALAPNDPVLAELVVRLGDAVPAPIRIAALDRLAERAEGPLRTTLLLGSAGVLEDEGRYEEAAERYRAVLAGHADEPIASAGLERVTNGHVEGPARLAQLRRAADETSTERERVQTLEQLLLCESEASRVVDTAHALLALAPSHPLALRALERDAMSRGDRAALRAVEERLVRESRGGRDRAARLRLYQVLHLLAESEGGGDGDDDLDQKVLAGHADAGQSLWLTRQLLNSAIASGRRDLVLRALALMSDRSSDAVEIASLAVQRGWLELADPVNTLESSVADGLAAYPEHPTAPELKAEIKRALGALDEAAEQFEAAASQARAEERAAHLYTRAALIWEHDLSRKDRAKQAYLRAAERSLDYPSVQERLGAMLAQEGDLDGLVKLTQTRIAKVEATDEALDLRRRLAELYEQQGKHAEARATLREALAIDPESLPVYRDLARLVAVANDPKERVEVLLAIARVSRDPLELRETLLALADVYERELDDPALAEGAYQRVLKLGPRNAQALERLASLYKRQGRHELAIDALAQLVRSVDDPQEKRDVSLRLSEWKREHGDERGAEEVLDALRRSAPTDRRVLARLHELLRAREDHTAFTLHLNRAVSELRQALAQRLDDPDLWCALIEALTAKDKRAAAAMCAECALALGLPLGELASHARTGERGITGAGLSELLDDLVYPESSPTSLRILFRHGADALNRVAPLDLRVFGAEKLDRRHPLRTLVGEQARWISARDPEIYTSSELPFAFVPIQDAPVQLLVGTRLLERTSPAEQQFLVARALKLARANMSFACRLPPSDVELWLHAVVRHQVASHAPPFLDANLLEEAARRLGKQLKRSAQQELAPHVLDLTYGGTPRFDGASVYGVASAAASRAGLLATGDVSAALSALRKISGVEEHEPTLASVLQIDELRELVLFATGEGYSEALIRTGKEEH